MALRDLRAVAVGLAMGALASLPFMPKRAATSQLEKRVERHVITPGHALVIDNFEGECLACGIATTATATFVILVRRDVGGAPLAMTVEQALAKAEGLK